MYVFIAIIFIAELIIASTILFFIVVADKKVCALSQSVVSSRENLINSIKSARCLIVDLKDKICSGIEFLSRKKQEYMMNIFKNILMYVLLFSLKGNCKKAASICNLVLMVKDFYDKKIC